MVSVLARTFHSRSRGSTPGGNGDSHPKEDVIWELGSVQILEVSPQ